MPDVSVLVSCWNYSCYLPECLDSILAQTVKPAEILLVDDASTDDTETIGRQYADAYPELVTYQQNEKRMGIVALLNRWVPTLTSEWCCSINADDWIDPTFLEAHARIIQSPLGADSKLALVYCAARFVCEEGAPYPEFHGTTIGGDPWNPIVLMSRNFVTGSAVFRKSAVMKVGGFPAVETHEDWMLWRRIALAGYHGIGIREALLNYRQHGRGHRNYGADHIREGIGKDSESVAHRRQLEPSCA